MKTKTAVEKIRMVLEKSPYKTGDNIEGKFVISPDGSIEFTIQRGFHSASYLFTEEGDLLLTVTQENKNWYLNLDNNQKFSYIIYKNRPET